MPRLTDAVKRHLVVGLAQFRRPAALAREVKEEFGVEVELAHACQYDPTRAAGKDLGKGLRTIFDEARAAFLNETVTIPAAHRAYRVQRLADMAESAEKRNNIPLAAALLRQIAEEQGGKLTNQHRIDLPPDALGKLFDMSPAQVDAVLRGDA